MEKFKNNKIFIIVIIVVFVIGVITVVYKKIKGENNNILQYELEGVIYQDEENNQIKNVQQDSTQANSKNNDNNNANSLTNNSNTSQIYIHIIGEVKSQGVVILNDGDRIIDAIEKAGGITEYADLTKVNLAFKLSDGQKVCIPNINDENENFAFVYDNSGNNVITGNENVGDSVKDKVNINTATQTELETLTGIGPSIAAKIIQYRKENGKFKSIEELKNVSGIGDSKFESIRDEVLVK